MIDPTLRKQVEQADRLAAQRTRQVDLNDWLEHLKAPDSLHNLAASVPVI